MSTKRFLPALLAALLLAAPAMAAEYAPGFEACIKKNPKSSDQKQCLDMERDYWQKKLDTRYKAMQGICKKFSGLEAEKRSAACLEALEGSQHSWLAYKASMRPVAENYPNSQSAMENLAWFEIDQLPSASTIWRPSTPRWQKSRPAAPIPWMTSRRACRISATAWNPCSIPA